MKKTIFYLFLFIANFSVNAQDNDAYKRGVLVQGEDTMRYRILFPESYDTSKNYPVIFFLHGAGERGSDNEKQLVHGSKLFLQSENRKNYPAIIIFPQCNNPGYWSNVIRAEENPVIGKNRFYFLPSTVSATRDMKMLIQLVNFVLHSYPVNKEKVYAGGLSMGGMGTFELVNRMPGIFAAAFPICGGGDTSLINTNMVKTKWWIFHGGRDDVVDPKFSKRMADELKRKKASVRYTIYPEANHNSWDAAFAEPTLLSWLFSQRKTKS